MLLRKKIFFSIIFLFIVLFVINFLNIFYILILKNSKDNQYNNYKIAHESDSILINNLSKGLILLSKNSNFIFPKDIDLIDVNSNRFNLADLQPENHKLVLRYDELTCQACIYKEMGNLKALSKKIGSENILVLASYRNIRDLLVTKRINNIDFPVYNIPLNSLNNSIENYNIPYIFVVDKNWNVSNLFIPNRELPDLTEEYFNDILKYFSTHD